MVKILRGSDFLRYHVVVTRARLDGVLSTDSGYSVEAVPRVSIVIAGYHRQIHSKVPGGGVRDQQARIDDGAGGWNCVMRDG